MIAAAVIASGYSRRMGRSKLTLPLGGRTFLERTVAAVLGAPSVTCAALVLRPEDASLHALLAQAALELITNPEAGEGQSASIRRATRHFAMNPACEALIFAVVDQPFLTPVVFDRLCAAWQDGAGEILISAYAGQRGNPVLFARRFFPELEGLAGDVGGRTVIQKHPEAVYEVEMPDPRAGRDVDTWEEYEEMQGDQERNGSG